MSAQMTCSRKVLNQTRLWCGIFLLLLTSSVNAADEVTYYHHDALGSTVAATDANGTLLWKEAYRPYGERIRKEDGNSNDIWYTGKQHEEAMGLSYFGARWYDPSIGRFMAIDPVGIDEGNIHSVNRYVYANNNPYKFVDPDGRVPVPVLIILGKVAVEGAKILIKNYGKKEVRKKAVEKSVAKGAGKTNQPKLKRIHSDETLSSGSNKFDLESQRTRSTQDITDSLKPGASEPLKVKPDGRIFDGNTRIKVLEERGVDINNLPRTIID